MSGPLTSLANTVETAPGAPSRNGHSTDVIPFGDGANLDGIEPSSYLALLPAIYSADPFVGRFLRIFEDVLDPITVLVDNQPYYFDPMTTPVELLQYMALWVDMDDEGEDWPLPKRRALVAAAPVLYRMRGTKAGLKQHLGIYLGKPPLLMERTNGFRLDSDARLGINTSIGESRQRTVTVTVVVRQDDGTDIDTVRSIIEADKPVDTNFILRVVKL